MDFFDLHAIFDYLSGQALWWGLSLLMLSALIEYVVPPFPGDAVTVAGAVLIPAAGWPLPAVFVTVTLGSVLGAAIDWRAGVWLAQNHHRNTWMHRLLNRDEIRPRVDKVINQFELHGSIYIAINRFVPAFRAVFFIAAGLADLPVWKVLAYGALSAALWNGALLGVGYLVGYNIDALSQWVAQYTQVVYAGLGIALVVWFGKKILGRLVDDR